MSDMPTSRLAAFSLTISTVLAALFVAVQTWYARVAYVDEQATRLLEDKIELCLQAFETAAELDAALRLSAPGMGLNDTWPPRIVVDDTETLQRIQSDVVPKLNKLQTDLIKGSILGELDKHRSYLVQILDGLSKRLLDLAPARMGEDKMDSEKTAVLAVLSEFLGAQYSVLTGCRLVAEGKA